MRTKEGLAIRQLGLIALNKSLKMLDVAFTLFKYGNKKEARRLWFEARKLRTNCFQMIAEADNLERDLRAVA
jgi:hypothetical protein